MATDKAISEMTRDELLADLKELNLLNQKVEKQSDDFLRKALSKALEKGMTPKAQEPAQPVQAAPEPAPKATETTSEAPKGEEPAPKAEEPAQGEQAVTQPEQPARRNSIVPAKYKEIYGRFGHCGDEMAQVLKAVCTGPKGECLPDVLVELAAQNGLTETFNRWAHLNVGQRRMNLGNVLRGKLKRNERVEIRIGNTHRVWNPTQAELEAAQKEAGENAA